jgi:hypothetical protein
MLDILQKTVSYARQLIDTRAILPQSQNKQPTLYNTNNHNGQED